MTDFLYNDLTSTILDCYYAVFRSPSSRGLTEDGLLKAICIELRKRNIRYQQNVSIIHCYDDRKVGHSRLDLVLDGKVVVEVKRLADLRERDKSRLKACLFDGGYAVGLLLNFGGSQPQTKRVYEASHDPRPVSQAEDGPCQAR